MFDAKLVATIRPSPGAKTSYRTGPTSVSDGADPVGSAFVESPHRQRRTLVAEPGQPGDLDRLAVDRVWSNR